VAPEELLETTLEHEHIGKVQLRITERGCHIAVALAVNITPGKEKSDVFFFFLFPFIVNNVRKKQRKKGTYMEGPLCLENSQ
jgi:hypothetical protein